MSSPIQVAKILKKEMDRKDFLKYSGGVVLAVVGVSSFVNTLVRLSDKGSSAAPQGGGGGYGASAYGR